MAMKKKAAFGSRAWRLLRLALLWARKGGAFKRGLIDIHHLRLAPGFFRSLKPGAGGRNDRLHYGEREFSIDETPTFKFKTPSMRLLRIPCITPPENFDDDDDDNLSFFGRGREREYIIESYDEEQQEVVQEVMEASCASFVEEDGEGEDGGVDVKAEEFIAKFYAQMKLQRQISWLQYNEMMERSLS